MKAIFVKLRCQLAGSDARRNRHWKGGSSPLTPDVITTDWNRSKTGLTAMDASIQLNQKIRITYNIQEHELNAVLTATIPLPTEHL